MKVSDEIIEVLDYMGEKFGIAIDWTNANVLPYVELICRKYIYWDITTSAVWIVFGILGFISGCKMLRWSDKNISPDDSSGFYIFIEILSVILMGICVIVIGCQIFDIIECTIFPEKRIYDFIQTYL